MTTDWLDEIEARYTYSRIEAPEAPSAGASGVMWAKYVKAISERAALLRDFYANAPEDIARLLAIARAAQDVAGWGSGAHPADMDKPMAALVAALSKEDTYQ